MMAFLALAKGFESILRINEGLLRSYPASATVLPLFGHIVRILDK
jgi:hypothetical protein